MDSNIESEYLACVTALPESEFRAHVAGLRTMALRLQREAGPGSTNRPEWQRASALLRLANLAERRRLGERAYRELQQKRFYEEQRAVDWHYARRERATAGQRERSSRAGVRRAPRHAANHPRRRSGCVGSRSSPSDDDDGESGPSGLSHLGTGRGERELVPYACPGGCGKTLYRSRSQRGRPRACEECRARKTREHNQRRQVRREREGRRAQAGYVPPHVVARLQRASARPWPEQLRQLGLAACVCVRPVTYPDEDGDRVCLLCGKWAGPVSLRHTGVTSVVPSRHPNGVVPNSRRSPVACWREPASPDRDALGVAEELTLRGGLASFSAE